MGFLSFPLAPHHNNTQIVLSYIKATTTTTTKHLPIPAKEVKMRERERDVGKVLAINVLQEQYFVIVSTQLDLELKRLQTWNSTKKTKLRTCFWKTRKNSADHQKDKLFSHVSKGRRLKNGPNTKATDHHTILLEDFGSWK